MSGVFIDMSRVEKLARDIGVAAPKVIIATEAVLDRVAAELQSDAKASAPVDTGRLQGSIFNRKNKMSHRVGSNVRYGFYQEFGTSKMAPQPWLFENGERAGEKLAISVLAAAEPL